MNVLYLLNFAGKAGTERYVETLVKYLSADGRVKPFFAYNQGGLLVERLETMGVPTRQVTMSSRFDVGAAKALGALCKAWGIQVIHCHYLRENYIAMLAKRYAPEVKVVYTNHFVMANDLPTRLSNRLLDKRQDRMIAVCGLGKEQLVKNGWSRERIQVVHNGVDLAAWAGERGESTIRAELGIPEDRFVMLCASRFAADKGHAYLLRSLKALAGRTQRPFTMLLAGDGPLLESAKAQAAELGLTDEQVRFLGFRRDIKNLYKGSDLYINSSQHEALSFLIIEAMAAGLPAVITNMAGNPDILKGPKDGGVLVTYDDADDLAGAMLRFMEEPGFLEECKVNALARVAEEFEVHKMCAATYAVYVAALAG